MPEQFWDVAVTPNEYRFAAMAGFFRHTDNRRDGKRDANGFAKEGWDEDVVGAVGEFAAAKRLRMNWAGQGLLCGPDVGQDVQVRSTLCENGHLLLHRSDLDDVRFILVTGSRLTMTWRLCGWLWGREGKLKHFWGDKANNGRPAFWVPQSALRPMGSWGE